MSELVADIAQVDALANFITGEDMVGHFVAKVGSLFHHLAAAFAQVFAQLIAEFASLGTNVFAYFLALRSLRQETYSRAGGSTEYQAEKEISFVIVHLVNILKS